MMEYFCSVIVTFQWFLTKLLISQVLENTCATFSEQFIQILPVKSSWTSYDLVSSLKGATYTNDWSMSYFCVTSRNCTDIDAFTQNHFHSFLLQGLQQTRLQGLQSWANVLIVDYTSIVSLILSESSSHLITPFINAHVLISSCREWCKTVYKSMAVCCLHIVSERIVSENL